LAALPTLGAADLMNSRAVCDGTALLSPRGRLQRPSWTQAHKPHGAPKGLGRSEMRLTVVSAHAREPQRTGVPNTDGADVQPGHVERRRTRLEGRCTRLPWALPPAARLGWPPHSFAGHAPCRPHRCAQLVGLAALFLQWTAASC
jgi:hypothetical protein